MMPPPRLVIATSNRGKLTEFQALLSTLPLQLVSLQDVGVTELPDEVGLTFAENARIKACAAARASGLSSLGDDSGLVVPALGGAPGLFSARYAGPGATDADNRARLLRELEGKSDRHAHFIAAICVANPMGEVVCEVEGRCEGEIVTVPRGQGGFGYDCLFLPRGLNLTFAELPANVKDEMSHRGRAVAALMTRLDPTRL